MKPRIKVSLEEYGKKEQKPQSEEETPQVPKKKKRIKKKKIDRSRSSQEKQLQSQQQKAEQVDHISQPIGILEQSRVRLAHLAICIPDSLVSLPQSSVIRSYFLSELARICSIFKVDEIVILHDFTYESKSDQFSPMEYMARNLQYLQTPQYLRKFLFEMHSDLKNAGIMNPIECDHHLKSNEVIEFREGVVIDRPTKAGSGSWVEIGLKQQAKIDYVLPPKTRVTVRLKNFEDENPKFYEAQAVSRIQPKIEKNLYWGYTIRMAHNLKHIFRGQQPYSKTILINHRPTEQSSTTRQISKMHEIGLQTDDRVLLFFSGYESLETMMKNDENCKISLEDLLLKFDCSYVFPKYGVKKLRIEQQMLIALNQMFEATEM